MTDSTIAARHVSLDALRGLAVMGILLMNIVAFAMPEAAYLNPRAYGGTTPLDVGVWAVNTVLVDGKMRALFSLLFGASMLLVIGGAEAKGESGVALHVRRMLWLAVFGLAHYYLIWFGDILFLYAVCGLLVFGFRHRKPGNLIKWASIFLIANFVLFALLAGSMFAMQAMASQPGADPQAVAAYRDMLPGIGAPGSPEIAKQLAVYSGGYPGILDYRTSGAKLWAPLVGLLISLVETIGLMLLGMALLKNGFLTGDWEPKRYRSFALRAYLIGLPLAIALAWWVIASGFDTVTTFSAMFSWSAPARIAIMLGHAALALGLIKTFAHAALVARIAAAGRAAFTNYLGTSILMTTIFYGYGLGLFGEVSRAGVYLFVFAAWAIMLLWSKPWLDRFAYGPLEWLWRSLARGKAQPMRKPA